MPARAMGVQAFQSPADTLEKEGVPCTVRVRITGLISASHLRQIRGGLHTILFSLVRRLVEPLTCV